MFEEDDVLSTLRSNDEDVSHRELEVTQTLETHSYPRAVQYDLNPPLLDTETSRLKCELTGPWMSSLKGDDSLVKALMFSAWRQNQESKTYPEEKNQDHLNVLRCVYVSGSASLPSVEIDIWTVPRATEAAGTSAGSADGLRDEDKSVDVLLRPRGFISSRAVQ
ncbi:unnamed protein product [Pleuronectes platessa]|uniref:Uncharacterized protein n=1 Tax=Pleuronectes platessa TaxID=8262 RepID=A0A9N7URA0_PLEPL|nr:unnamed protein product [Pleuronectes platessa]